MNTSTEREEQGQEQEQATDANMLAVGRWLQSTGYRFTTITPASHAIVNARPANRRALTVEDVFGWSRPFGPGLLPDTVTAPLMRAGLLGRAEEDLWQSAVRFSTLGAQHELLLAHSGFPTERKDAVFFGPDSYRFAAFVGRTLAAKRPASPRPRVVDIGCGSGAGGLQVARRLRDADLTLTDINPAALRFATVNAALCDVPAHVVRSDLYSALSGAFDLIIANPPFMSDDAGRTYRDGTGELGTGLALRVVEEGIGRLAPGGMLILYTGAPVVRGQDIFRDAVTPVLEASGCACGYEEIDPDVFGEELAQPAYAEVDRIAAVGLVVRASEQGVDRPASR